MKKKIFLMLAVMAMLICIFAISVSAADFGAVTLVDGITTVDGLDTTSRVLMSDGITYPSAYIFKNLKDIDFSALTSATGKSYDSSSVVMIEYPEGCTYVSRTFAGSTTLEYVYFSSTITGVQWGTFLQCSNLTVVEFAENSTITAMNTDCFAGTGIVELKLPNSLQTVNENFLRGSSNLTTVHFGESFTQIFNRGAFFAGCGKLKALYVPAGNFDENGDISIVSNFFGWNDRDSSFRNGGVIYYTGTKAQAQYIIDKELQLYAAKNESTAVWNTIQLVSIDEFNAISADEKSSKCYMVYEYNKCDAFYSGKHLTAEQTYDFTAFTEKSYLRSVCTRCEAGTVLKEIAPLFTCRGYSVPENGNSGITIGYVVNYDAIEYYEQLTGKTVRYGVFVVLKDRLGSNDIFDAEGKTADGVISADLSASKFTVFQLKIVGFKDEQKDVKLAMGAYVAVTDGETTEYSYMQVGEPNENEKYCFVSYNDVIANSSTGEQVTQ